MFFSACLSYQGARWLHKHWMVIRLCMHGPVHHSQPALSKKIFKLSNLLDQFFYSGNFLTLFCVWACLDKQPLPCSDKDSNFPCFRNHCPSMLPVTEKAQQDPHIPWKTHTDTQRHRHKESHTHMSKHMYRGKNSTEFFLYYI